tara:strand:+ start:175 stop:525 length:351 start_codon:yes stop_codon:yes gene_type:complete
MKNFINFTQLIIILVTIASCKTSNDNKESIKNSDEPKSEQINIAKSKIELRYSCGEDGVSEFLNDGWVIVEEYTEEKICTWKSIPATKDCNMDKDKGCKITIPDRVGEEKVYLLEK